MYLNKYSIFLAVSTAIILSGCGAKGAKVAGFQEPSNGNAMVYVYRPSNFVGSVVSYDVHANDGSGDKLIGKISNGAYANTEVPADKEVEIWGKTEAKSSVTIDTESNRTYCIKAGVGIGFFVGRPHLKQVDMQTCEKEITKTSLDK